MTTDSKATRVILPLDSERLSWRTAATILTLTLTMLCGLSAVSAQDEHKRKVPGLEKLSPGYSHQAFTGRVLSLDVRRSVLNVNAVRGSGTEIFALKKKSVRVEAANGDRLKLEELQPGTNVIVYYDQRGEQRSVKDIVVLQAAQRNPVGDLGVGRVVGIHPLPGGRGEGLAARCEERCRRRPEAEFQEVTPRVE